MTRLIETFFYKRLCHPLIVGLTLRLIMQAIKSPRIMLLLDGMASASHQRLLSLLAAPTTLHCQQPHVTLDSEGQLA